MKYNININQEIMLKNKLCINKWLILDIIATAPTWCQAIILNDTTYFYISRNKIREELIAFDLKLDTIYRHLKSLFEDGFILYLKHKNKDLIALTEKGKSLFSNSEINPNSEIDSDKLGNKSENNSEINPTYNNTSLYNNTKNKKEKDKKENLESTNDLLENLLEENTEYEKHKDLIFDFIQYRKKIKKPVKTIEPLKALIRNLEDLQELGYTNDFCLEQMKSSEWQTVKVDYIHKPDKNKSRFLDRCVGEKNRTYEEPIDENRPF